MLLPKLEIDLLTCRRFTRTLNIPRRNIGTTEIDTHIRAQRTLQTADIRTIHNAITHPTQQAREIRATEICACLQLSQGIFIRAYGIQDDVLRCVGVDFLGEVGVDAEELVAVGAGFGLGFERLEQHLQPLERIGVLADPDEFDAAEAFGRVGGLAEAVDALEN